MFMSLQRRLPQLSHMKRVELVAPRGGQLLQRKTWAVRETKIAMLLSRLGHRYSVACVDGGMAQRSAVLYLDTADERCQFDHLRGITPRVEVRQRENLLTGACQLEVSTYQPNGRERTSTLRITRLGFLDARADAWLRERLPFDPMLLQASVRSTFTRLTLPDHNGAQLVIDLDLSFTVGETQVRTGAMAQVSLVGPPELNTRVADAVLNNLAETRAARSPWALALPLVRLREEGAAAAKPRRTTRHYTPAHRPTNQYTTPYPDARQERSQSSKPQAPGARAPGARAPGARGARPSSPRSAIAAHLLTTQSVDERAA